MMAMMRNDANHFGAAGFDEELALCGMYIRTYVHVVMTIWILQNFVFTVLSNSKKPNQNIHKIAIRFSIFIRSHVIYYIYVHFVQYL